MSLGDQYLDIQHKILEPWPHPKNVGSYAIKRPLADGGFSKVYLAEHQVSGLEVVLKCASKTLPNLVSEIMNLRMFHHPHIVRLYEIIIGEKEVWLAMEYCHGEELLGYLQRGPCDSFQAVSFLFAQLCGAVAYIHARHHCAHRDIKLENILLDAEGNLKLADFGFTRNYSSKSLLDTICGTTPYMAPELLNREKYTPEATDVWSLGVILYALIYAQLPFDEETDHSTKLKILKGTPQFPEMPAFEPGLREILSAMLSKDPRKRPTAAEILANPIWGQYGAQQMEILTAPVMPQFTSRAEKLVLKGLSTLKVDIAAVTRSVQLHKCDPLHGLWFTLLEKQKTSESLNRRKSDAPSLRSLQRVARGARGIVRAPPISPHSTRFPSNFSRLTYDAPSTTSSVISATKPSFRQRLRELFVRDKAAVYLAPPAAREFETPEPTASMPPIAEESLGLGRGRTISQLSEYSSLSDTDSNINVASLLRYQRRGSSEDVEEVTAINAKITATAIKKLDSPIKKLQRDSIRSRLQGVGEEE